MSWLKLFLIVATELSPIHGARALEGPTLSWRIDGEYLDPTSKLVQMADGWLALIAVNSKVQFRSPTGKWSRVIDFPIQEVEASAAAGAAVLVAGEGPGPHRLWQRVVLLIGIDGSVNGQWEIPDLRVQSLAAWQNSRWATGYAGFMGHHGPKVLWALLPGGKVETRDEIPTIVEDGEAVVPWRVFLYLGPSGEKVFCVPETCEHDLPCHYALCYRRDKVVWEAYGKWLGRPVLCSDYLLEQEVPVPWDPHLHHVHSRTVVRRISDGVKVASVGTGPNAVIACATPDTFVAADTSVVAMSLATGRRRWSVPVRAGRAVAVAQAGECTIALTNRDEMMSICPGNGNPVVTTTGTKLSGKASTANRRPGVVKP